MAVAQSVKRFLRSKKIGEILSKTKIISKLKNKNNKRGGLWQ